MWARRRRWTARRQSRRTAAAPIRPGVTRGPRWGRARSRWNRTYVL
ncbi:hypothetical protein B0I28_104167 [Glycomyces artemisiae]|uniref:Uncharacterized protein n=1 Tax=Glycomyces artemisiae TaxID=1076443 RepID=A0A2T0UM57_9ACTN|nr:hypothetical protein B0I28_104167 [Glycomyces artemisiae]